MDQQKAQRVLKPQSVWIPVIIGLGIVVAIFLTDDNLGPETFSQIQNFSVPALILGLLILVSKDLINTGRFHFLQGKELGLTSAVRVIFLWEFAIAVTPPVIGATGVLVFIMFKEGLSLGKALACTLLLATFDNLFFLTASPIAIWLSSGEVIPESSAFAQEFGRGLEGLFWLSYGLIVLYSTFMLSAVLLFPQTIRRLTSWIMGASWLKRWRNQVLKQVDDLVAVSQLLKGKTLAFWLKLLGLSYLVWIFKYSLLNIIIAGIVDVSLVGHLQILGRHLIMWVVLLVSPAPGNAGTAEFIFPAFFESYLGQYTFITALLWRALSYYPYLIIGAILLPKWFRRK